MLSLRIDPDGVISRYGLGLTAGGSLEVLAQGVRHCAADPAAVRDAGEKAYRYVEREHAPEVVGPQWDSLVERLLEESELKEAAPSKSGHRAKGEADSVTDVI